MRWPRILRKRLRSVFRRSRVEDELQRELDIHIEQIAGQYRAAGMSEAEARLAARREFGSLDLTREECRDMRKVNLIDDTFRDLAYAARVLFRSPGFTLTAILSLALGIGANTAIFSVVNAFLLRPLPYREPGRIVALFERRVMADEERASFSPGNFLDWQKSASSFESMSAYTTSAVTLSGSDSDSAAERVVLCNCSGNLFATLGVAPAQGRAFTAEEDRNGAPRVLIISDSLWQRRFGGMAGAIGKKVLLNGIDYQIIGVMPPRFTFPVRQVDIWIPFMTGMSPQMLTRHDLHMISVVARVKPAVSVEQVRAEIDGIAARYKSAHPEEATGRGATAIPLHTVLVEDVRTPLIVLFGAVFCVLLIACVNITNLTLTRAAGRTREIGVRMSLGAGRGRIMRQLVTESILLSIVGGVLGTVAAYSIAGVLAAHAPGANAMLPPGKFTPDASLLLFALGLALATGIVVGAVPALRVSRRDLATQLKDSGRSATMGRAQGNLRNMLVAAEVGLSLVLLLAAGLLLHSFARLSRVDTGMRMDHTLTLSISLSDVSYREPARRAAAIAELGERMQRIPGVKSAGVTSCTPLSGACNVLFFYVDGRPFVSGKFFSAFELATDPGFFAAAGIPLRRGRTFTRQDGIGWDPEHPRTGAIVISESMARRFFPNEDPLGKRIFFDYEVQNSKQNPNQPTPKYEIVGVVADTVRAVDRDPAPTLYRPLLDVAYRGFTVLLHTAVEPLSVASAARAEIRNVNPRLAPYRVRTLEELLGTSTADRQFSMFLFAAFAGLALLLAVIGLYGLVSYAISQRRAEFGIRMALGATPSDVSRLALLEGIKPAAAGVVCGVIAGVFVCRVLRTQLFGITPADPLTFAIVPPLLLLVAVLACYVPSIRATRLNPTVALRAE